MALGHALAMGYRSMSGGLLGPELLTNGDFASDTVWVKGSTWTISAGVASVNAPAAVSLLSQSLSLTVGAMYQVQITLSAYTSGSCTLRFTNAGSAVGGGPTLLAAGTYIEYMTLGGVADSFSVRAPNALAVYSIDNVSLRRVS